MEPTILAYHFLQVDMTASRGSDPPWAVGEKRKVEGKLSLCAFGYHSSPTPFDALQYAPGPILCLVEVPVRGTIKDTDKQVSRSRKLIKCANVERTLHEIACRIAEDVLPIYERQEPNDPRPRKAIEAKRRWLAGQATEEELAAARAAARDAARDAARAAAEAAARAAAMDAARDAAWAAARDKYRGWINMALEGALRRD